MVGDGRTYLDIAIDMAERRNYEAAAIWASIAQALAEERQAMALESIARNMEMLAGKRGIVHVRNSDAI